MDLAIGVIIGGAFSAIVTALTENIIQPIINLLGGAEVHGTIVLATNAAGEVTSAIDYGAFITAIINFILVAFVLLRKRSYFQDTELGSDFICALIWPISLIIFGIGEFACGLDRIVRKLFDR